MSTEPTFPQDAAIGSGSDKAPSEIPAEPAPVEPVEPVAATSEDEGRSKRSKQMVAGAAIGIGSAAIVAALLYANRSGKSDKPLPPIKPAG